MGFYIINNTKTGKTTKSWWSVAGRRAADNNISIFDKIQIYI